MNQARGGGGGGKGAIYREISGRERRFFSTVAVYARKRSIELKIFSILRGHGNTIATF